MPIIIITGIPSSGKTKRMTELREHFENTLKKKVEIVSETEYMKKAGFDRDTLYAGKVFYLFICKIIFELYTKLGNMIHSFDLSNNQVCLIHRF